MITNFTKNLNPSYFQNVLNKFKSVLVTREPLWRGTVYVGIWPVYVECYIKWMADKINAYFVDARENVHIDGAKEIYVLNEGVENFVDTPLSDYSDLFFLGDDVFAKPDMITNKDYIFLKTENSCYITVSDKNPRHVLYLDENHLLARLFYYIFEPAETMVLHGAAVAYDDYGILITGLSGSGKSTLSAYCLANGMRFIGDDKIALHMQDGELYANPIYNILSLKQPVPGVKYVNTIQQDDAYKDVFILDKSQISKNVKIRAIVEPHRAGLTAPELETMPIAPVITRICTDYSMFSVLTPTKNPLVDYRKIFNLFSGIESYKINLSESISDNALAFLNLAKKGSINV